MATASTPLVTPTVVTTPAPSTHAKAVPPKDWSLRSDGAYVRDLEASELLLAWMHENRDGGVRCSSGVDVQTNFNAAEFEPRIRHAWGQVVRKHPAVGLTYEMDGKKGKAIYRPHDDERTAETWRWNTCVFIGAERGTLEELIDMLDNWNTHPSDGSSRLYVICRESGKHSMVLNGPHVCWDTYSIGVLWYDIFKLAVKYDQTVRPWGPEVQFLPRSMVSHMDEYHPDTIMSQIRTLGAVVRSVRAVTANSVRLPMTKEIATRRHGSRYIVFPYPQGDSKTFNQICKGLGTTVTYMMIGILGQAMQELFSRSNPKAGQVFAMPFNGRRWMPADLPPVAPFGPGFGTTTAYIHIERVPSKNTKEGRLTSVIRFAKLFKEKSTAIIEADTPDSVKGSRKLSPFVLSALSKSDPANPRPSVFGIVSQGNLDKIYSGSAPIQYKDNKLEVTYYYNGGRIVDNNPMMILYTYNKQLWVRFQWSNKYYTKDTFELLKSRMDDLFYNTIETAPAFIASKNAAKAKAKAKL